MHDVPRPMPIHLAWRLRVSADDPLEYGRCLVKAAREASLPGLRVAADVAGEVLLEFDDLSATGPIEALVRGCAVVGEVLALADLAVPENLGITLGR